MQVLGCPRSNFMSRVVTLIDDAVADAKFLTDRPLAHIDHSLAALALLTSLNHNEARRLLVVYHADNAQAVFDGLDFTVLRFLLRSLLLLGDEGRRFDVEIAGLGSWDKVNVGGKLVDLVAEVWFKTHSHHRIKSAVGVELVFGLVPLHFYHFFNDFN